MNADRRKQIESIQNEMDNLKQILVDAIAEANELESKIQDINDEEQEYFDNMPESMQQGEKGSDVQDKISELENAVSSIQGVISDIDNAESNLRDVSDSLSNAL